MTDHDTQQMPLCPSCASEHIHENNVGIFKFQCNVCRTLFDHPIWVDHDPDYEQMAKDCRPYLEAKIEGDLDSYRKYITVTTDSVPYGDTYSNFETYEIDESAYAAVAEECWENGLINYKDGKYVVEEM